MPGDLLPLGGGGMVSLPSAGEFSLSFLDLFCGLACFLQEPRVTL
jgi:hypothetical protein